MDSQDLHGEINRHYQVSSLSYQDESQHDYLRDIFKDGEGSQFERRCLKRLDVLINPNYIESGTGRRIFR